MNSHKFRKLVFVLMVLVLLLPLAGLTQAQGPEGNRASGQLQPVEGALKHVATYEQTKTGLEESDVSADVVGVIVDLEAPGLASYNGDIAGLVATSPAITGAAHLDMQTDAVQSYLAYVNAQIDAFQAAALQIAPEAQIVHRFDVAIGGASLVVPAAKLAAIAALPGVKAVYPDELVQPDTDVSPQFIGATTIWDNLGGQEAAGEGVVVGVIDTGVWPEHPSFSDPDPAGNAYPAPPGGPYACEFGNSDWNSNDVAFECNNKLIGAYNFTDAYKAVIGLEPVEFDSARDSNGHGTHTSSTAAGNGQVAASIMGSDLGLVSGIAPRAHVIMYKSCGLQGCFSSDLTAGIQQAIIDGVDVINYSISGGESPYESATSLAFLDAYAAGIFVAASAGNSGPSPDTVAHREPWVTTVAASTHNRSFVNTVTLTGTISNTVETLSVDGVSVTGGYTATVVLAADFGDALCLEPFPEGTFNGEIVICERGQIARVAKSANVAAGGAGGLVLYNPNPGQSLMADNHFIPASHVDAAAGQALLDFMATHTEVTGEISAGQGTEVSGNVMAGFSSRGGPGQTLGVSKPDITAPGVQILAGHTPFPDEVAGGVPGQLFQAIAGTSMSSPQIAGSAALVKALHPEWTPGQIKSALMTTARQDVVKEDGQTPADPFDFGSGHVDLTGADDPGLTFSDSAVNYVMHRDNLWDANYPSLYVPNLPGSIHVQRTAHSEINAFSRWTVTAIGGDDWSVGATDMIAMDAYGDAVIDIWIDASKVPDGEVRFGGLLIESNYGHQVWFPISFVKRSPVIAVEKTCAPTDFYLGATTDCTITLTNTSLNDASFSLSDRLPPQLQLVPGTLVGATADGNGLILDGGLGGSAPADVTVAVDPTASPVGYLALSGFNSLPVSMSDESIDVWNVPSFQFAGVTYNQIGIVSNGYIVLGGGDAGDVDWQNQALPDPARPNNVLAPFWTDLNPGAGGQGLINVLTDGVNSWIAVEWENVPNFSDGNVNTFQVWIGTTQADDISFTYGTSISAGDGGFLTVGAENNSGSTGGMVYYNGQGAPPAPSYPDGDYEVDVLAVPGAPGETRTVTYQATGAFVGAWENCASVSSNAMAGQAIACANGNVSEPPPPPEPVEVTATYTVTFDTPLDASAPTVNQNGRASMPVFAGIDSTNGLLTFDSLPLDGDLVGATLKVKANFESGALGKSITVLNVDPAFDPLTVTWQNAQGLNYFNPSSGVALGTVPGVVEIDATSNIGACMTAGNARCQLAISVTSPAGAGRVSFDTLETFGAMPATLTITRSVISQ